MILDTPGLFSWWNLLMAETWLPCFLLLGFADARREPELGHREGAALVTAMALTLWSSGNQDLAIGGEWFLYTYLWARLVLVGLCRFPVRSLAGRFAVPALLHVAGWLLLAPISSKLAWIHQNPFIRPGLKRIEVPRLLHACMLPPLLPCHSWRGSGLGKNPWSKFDAQSRGLPGTVHGSWCSIVETPAELLVSMLDFLCGAFLPWLGGDQSGGLNLLLINLVSKPSTLKVEMIGLDLAIPLRGSIWTILPSQPMWLCGSGKPCFSSCLVWQ